MRKKDINELFTNTLREYMDKGFIVNAQTMTGMSSYEICKVDLTDGKDIYRFLLEETHEHYDDPDPNVYLYIDGIRFSIHRHEVKELHSRLVWGLWNYEGEIIREDNFYRMPNRSNHETVRDAWYTPDFDAVINAERIHAKRREAKRILRPFGEFYEYRDSAKRKLLPLVRRLPRCKTAHLEDIGDVWRHRREDGRSVINLYVKGNQHAVYLGKEESA